MLLLAFEVIALCVPARDPDLLQCTCEGGSIKDLEIIPDYVQSIIISDMPVHHINASTFSKFSGSVVQIICNQCQLTDIADDAFQKLVNLKQLSLSGNNLTEVRAAQFKGLNNLIALNLNFNAITSIDGEVFLNSPELSDFHFTGNQLRCLDFEKMSQLKVRRLELRENPYFTCLDELQKFTNQQGIHFIDVWGKPYREQVRTKVKTLAKIFFFIVIYKIFGSISFF